MESCVNEKESDRFYKGHMERVMNEESDWDHNVKGHAVERPVVCASREDVV